MARPWSRKGRDDGEDGRAPHSGRDDEHVDLDGEEHAWWAQRDVSEVWAPRGEPPREPDDGRGGERDILADHLGEDWRTAFGFTTADGTPVTEAPEPQPAAATPEAEAPLAPEPVDASDPYAVLDVASTATWEEIVDAHRRQARRHHPDRLVGRPDDEVAAAEDRIRHINAAYRQLKVRRGR
ncbi:MAG: J domain-containing protein [Acidimicrobiales bacterium]